MAQRIATIFLIESSASLREKQHHLLCGSSPLEKHPLGYSSFCDRLPSVRVVWTEDLAFLPIDQSASMPFVIAHEYFDALPIHAFQSVKPAVNSQATEPTISTSASRNTGRSGPSVYREWRELLVSATAPPSVIKPPSSPQPEFELVVSPRGSPHSQYLPSVSPRYRHVLNMPDGLIEVCPTARINIAAIARMVGGANPTSELSQPPARPQAFGAALIIDYGPSDTVPANSLRGVRQHKRCSPFESPGSVDVSADVDFEALAEAALEASQNVAVYGPALQSDWLGAMGGNERSKALEHKADSGEIAARIRASWQRLTDRGPNGMGQLYKAMAIVPLSAGQRRPVGFGGDISPSS